MHIDHVLLVGAGGHAKVVLDALFLSYPQLRSVQVVDDNFALQGKVILGVRVAAPVPTHFPVSQHFHVAIGNNNVRQQLSVRLLAAGGSPLSVIHPTAVVSPFAQLEGLVFVAAGAILAASAQVGRGCIINHGAVVDHDCVIGACCHVAPNATLAGGVMVGERVLVGAGANILPGIKVGHDAMIGAGAVVCRDVPAGAVWVGVPAQNQDKRSNQID